MVRYILVGGYPWKAIDGGRAFAEACVKATKDPITILVCLFARDEAEWQQAYEDDVARFSDRLPGRNLKFVLASKDGFAEQVEDANVIYLRGGDSQQLIRELAHSKALLKRLDNKTLVGTSAGADAIAAYYCNLDDRQVARGLALLPVKVLVHYESDYGNKTIDWAEAYKTLDSYGQKLELLPIREGQFVVR